MIQKAIILKNDFTEITMFAPYVGYTIFIINESHLIFEDEITKDWDFEYYAEAYEIIETVQ